ncbi:MAG: hypothetical protein WCH86_02765 [Kiritimatiellales bacterium]
MRRSKFIALTILILSALMLPSSARACEIVLQELEEVPAVNSETTLVVEYHQIHRNCSQPLSTIKFKAKGMTILSETSWEETGPNAFQRKFEVKIDESDCSLKVNRSCLKGGLNQKLSVKTQE